MPAFDDMFKKFFENNDFPNPFDPEGFGRFIQEQIKNAMPENIEQNGGQSQSGQAVDFSSQPKPSNQSQGQPRRNGTNSGLGRPQNQAAGRSVHQQGTAAQPSQPQQQQELNYQAFETHDDFIVRVEIVEDPSLQPKKIALNSHQINFFNEERNQPLLHIQLPKPVEAKEIKAGFRQGILEIKLPKKPDEPVIGIDLRDMYKSAEAPTSNQQAANQPKPPSNESTPNHSTSNEPKPNQPAPNDRTSNEPTLNQHNPEKEKDLFNEVEKNS